MTKVLAIADRLAARPLVLVVALVVSAGLLYGQAAHYWGTADRTVDSYTYTLAAKTLSDGGNPYDTDEINDRAPDDFAFVFPYLYPPPLAVSLRPMSALDPVVVHRSFVLWGVVIALANVLLVWKIASPASHARGWLLLGLLTVSVTGPIVSTIRLGQINSWVVALVLLALWSEMRHRSWLAGSCLAAAIAIKLTPFVFVADLVFRRRWRTLLATAVAGAVIVGASVAWAGTEVWSQYLERALTPLPFNPPMSLRGLAQWIGERGLSPDMSRGLGLVLVTAVVGWMIVRLPRLDGPVGTWSFLSLFSLLVSPLTWHHHYYLAMLPFGVGLVRRVDEGRPSWVVWGWLLLAAAALLRYPGALAPLKPLAALVALFRL